MQLSDKICISLLTIAIIGVLTVGILYPFITTTVGPIGEKGAVGPQGKSIETLYGSILQLNTVNFSTITSTVSQYSNTILCSGNGTLIDVPDGSTLMLGIIAPTIQSPKTTANGTCFYGATLVPLSIDTGGIITIGPGDWNPLFGETFNFFIVYSV